MMSTRFSLKWLALGLSLGIFQLALAQSSSPGSAGRGSTEEAALRELTESYFNAWSTKDLDGYLLFWNSASPGLKAKRKFMQDLFDNSERIEIKNLRIRNLEIEGNQARVGVAMEATVTDAKTAKPRNGYGKIFRTLRCTKEMEGWKIWEEIDVLDEFASLLGAADSDQQRAKMLEQEPELRTVELQRALLRRGGGFSEQKMFDRAIELYRFARELSESLDDRTGVALALRNSGFAYALQENYRKALEYFEKSLALRDGLSRVSQAELLRNTGVMHYSLGEYMTALDYSRKSLSIFEELKDEKEIIGALINIAVIYRGQGDFVHALECYQRCIKMLETFTDPVETARVYNNMAVVYSIQGDHNRALEGFQKSLKITESLPHPSEGVIADSYINIGNVHLEQGNARLALDFYQRSLSLRKKEGKKSALGVAYNRIGRAYVELGENEAALDSYREALAQWEAIEHSSGLAHTLLSVGNLYLREQRYQLALDHINRSLGLYESMGDIHGTAGALVGLASVYYQQGDFQQAMTLLARAIPIAEKNGSLELLAEVYTLGGDIQFKLGQENLSRQNYERAIVAVERLRQQTAGGERDRQRSLENKLAPWHGMIRLLVNQKNDQEALLYAEKSRARTLLDVLHSGNVDIRKLMSIEEQEQERKLRVEAASLNAQLLQLSLAKKSDPAEISDVKRKLEQARLAYESFQTSLYAAHQELRARRGETPVVGLKDLSTFLPVASAAVIEYVVTQEKTYMFVVTRNAAGPEARVQTFLLPAGSSELAMEVETFREQLANHNLGFRKQARKLYELLLKPAQGLFRGKAELIIAPDGVLWELPFQALLNGENRFQIEDTAISYTPSLTALREMTKIRQKRETGSTPFTLLALGNPKLGRATVERATLTLRDGALGPLPEAEAEVQSLGKLYGSPQSKVYIGAEASEARLKTDASKARILHIAAHGVLNNASPMYSHLALAQGDKNEDGLLEAWELMQLDLNADLAVLSACETARGRFTAGEGMIGLSWVLFVAGVPSTIVSQWNVESESTREFMLDFYRHMRAASADAKSTKASALQQAALKLMKQSATSHPFYWAGFVLVGDGR